MGKFSVVSADSHVVEPADLWLNLIEPAFRDRAPRVVRDQQKNEDFFWCEGELLLSPAFMSIAGQPRTKADRTLAGVLPGAYDPHARLKDMARDGVEAEVLYPSIAMRIFALKDRPLVQACFRAYDTWIAGFCRAYPDRFKGIAMIDLDNIEEAVSETHRAKKLGLAGLMVTLSSDDPRLYSGASYDPFWAAAETLGLPVSLHIATDKKLMKFELPWKTTHAADTMRSLTNMIFGGLFLRFPKLRVVSAENDAGWAGYFIEKMDYLYTNEGQSMNDDYPIKGKGMLPSEYMRRNVALTFIYDRSGVEARHWFGVENLMWSSDYPHNASTWPDSREVQERLFKGVPAGERRKIVAENAERIYAFA